jgi:hypothetical protein
VAKKKDLLKIKLIGSPACAEEGERITLCKRINGRWSVWSVGRIISGTRVVANYSVEVKVEKTWRFFRDLWFGIRDPECSCFGMPRELIGEVAGFLISEVCY